MVEEARKRGRLVVATAYADYRRADMEDLQLVLFQLGFRLVHCPSWPSGGTLKSVVDPIMAQDLRDTLETHPNIDIFMIGTGDRDFIPVAHALRYHGCQVVMVASPDCANRELIACADEFVALPASTPRVIEPLIAQRRQPRQQRGRYSQTQRESSSPIVPPTPVATTVTSLNSNAIVSPEPVTSTPVAQPAVRQAPRHTVQRAATVTTTSRPIAPQPVPAEGVKTDPAMLTREGVLEEVARRQQAGEPPTPRQLARALVPGDDAEGRLRSFVSNMVADLLKEGRLIRIQARQHGRLVEAVALPDGALQAAVPATPKPVEAVAEPTPVEAVPEPEVEAAPPPVESEVVEAPAPSAEPVKADETTPEVAAEAAPVAEEPKEEAAPAPKRTTRPRRTRATAKAAAEDSQPVAAQSASDEVAAPAANDNEALPEQAAAKAEAEPAANGTAPRRRRTRRTRAEAETEAASPT